MAGKQPTDSHNPVTLQGNEGNWQSVDEDGNAKTFVGQDFKLDAYYQEQLRLQMEILRQLEILNKYMAFGFEVNFDEKIEG